MSGERVRVFDSRSEDYRRAFEVFLAHTDQKRTARRRLDELVAGLPSRELLIDAGAGEGMVTGWLAPAFRRAVAVEPNPFLRERLRRAVPRAEVLGGAILEAEPPGRADLVLASHVFYYIPREAWLANLERLVAWTAPGGLAVVLLQNGDTDCMALLDRFVGVRYDLAGLAEEFRAAHGGRAGVRLARVDAHVETRDFDTACTVAEFMLNVAPIGAAPLRSDLEAYVRERFAAPGGGFRFSCHQDCLEIRPR